MTSVEQTGSNSVLMCLYKNFHLCGCSEYFKCQFLDTYKLTNKNISLCRLGHKEYRNMIFKISIVISDTWY